MALGFVRPARPEDAAEIARIQLATWRVAYRRLLPRHVLDNLDEAWLARRWSAAVRGAALAAHRVLVAVEQAEQSYLVGFAASGPADDEALAPDEPAAAWAPDVAAVTDLLVEPRWGRRGHGSRLLAAAVDLWRDDGFATRGGLGLRRPTRRPASSSPAPAGSPTARPARWTSTTCWSPSYGCTSAVPADRPTRPDPADSVGPPW